MKRICIVKAGESLAEIVARRGDFEVWIADGLGVPLAELDVVDVFRGQELPAADAPAAVVVTGSPSMVSEREGWSEAAGRWLADAYRAGTPLLGLCYGHQLIAQALGGRVGPNPRGRQIGTVAVELVAGSRDDPLLRVLPPHPVVHATHVESVLEPPPGAQVLGSTALDPFHVLRFGRRAWGVQFHPEFDADIMRGYLEGRRAILEAEGFDVPAVVAAVGSSPGVALLARFGDWVRDHPSGERVD